MKLAPALLGLLATTAEAFAPVSRSSSLGRSPLTTTTTTSRYFGVDPSQFSDISQHMQSLQDAMSSISLADAAEVATDIVTSGGDAAADAAAAAASTTSNSGWFGFLTMPIEGVLKFIHSSLVAVGLSSNAWGLTIILLTVLIKALTFPLTKQQLESTTKMQAMSPKIKEIQAKYQSNPEVMNQKIAEFYQVNEINPLAGCLPSVAQIPIFIGLYRAVLQLASNNALDEPFLFLPNLEGPTYGADPAHGSDWLFQGWTDGVPPLGWDDTISFLILPVFLVISQFVSMELMQPKTDDPSQQQTNVILKVLPVMIGWFALNVPAALSVYWVVNNIVTTGTSLFIRNNLKVEPVAANSDAGSATMEPPSTVFAPPREKPSGFASPSPAPVSSDSVKPLTPIDAEVLEDGDDGEDDGDEDGSSSATGTPKKKRRGKKGKKKKN